MGVGFTSVLVTACDFFNCVAGNSGCNAVLNAATPPCWPVKEKPLEDALPDKPDDWTLCLENALGTLVADGDGCLGPPNDSPPNEACPGDPSKAGLEEDGLTGFKFSFENVPTGIFPDVPNDPDCKELLFTGAELPEN